MSSRIKVDVPKLSMDDVARMAGEVAAASHALDANTAKLNGAIDELKAQHVELRQQLAAEIQSKTEQLERWASANPQAFGDSRSIDLTRAIIGFRIGQPTVKTIKAVSQADAIEALMREPGGDLYIRLGKPALDKDGIIRDREAIAAMLPRVGLKVVQEERFYIEPKKEEPAEAPRI